MKGEDLPKAGVIVFVIILVVLLALKFLGVGS